MRGQGWVVSMGVSVLAMSAIAVAQGAGPVAIVRARQQAFKQLGTALKIMHNEVRGSSPDAAKIGAAASEVKSAASHLAEWFPAGTGPQAGLKTHARAEIWTDERGFAAARAAFTRQADKSVRQLSDLGDRGAWKDAVAALGQTCRDCHDAYRVKTD